MMRAILLLMMFAFPLIALSKGAQGKYYIAGIAYGADKKPLANDSVQVSFKGKKWFVRTDTEGRYEIEIEWISACPSGISNAERQRQNRKLNPPIDISYHKDTVKLPNEWRRFAGFAKPKEEATWKKDIVFG